MFGKVGLSLAVGIGIYNGLYVFEPYFRNYQKNKELQQTIDDRDSNKASSPSSSSPSSSLEQHQQRSSIPEHLRTADEQRRFLKSILPSTVVAASAHPDHAAKVMDHPLPAMRLTAKKIPTDKEAGEMQAEPYAVKDGDNWYEKVRFW